MLFSFTHLMFDVACRRSPPLTCASKTAPNWTDALILRPRWQPFTHARAIFGTKRERGNPLRRNRTTTKHHDKTPYFPPLGGEGFSICGSVIIGPHIGPEHAHSVACQSVLTWRGDLWCGNLVGPRLGQIERGAGRGDQNRAQGRLSA